MLFLHILKKGEGDRSLDYWKAVHPKFFIRELNTYHQALGEAMLMVCEEFKVVWK